MPPAADLAPNQRQTLLRLLGRLQPRLRSDRNLPARIQQMLAQRAFGARDRRLYRELIYATLRYLPWIEPLLDKKPETAALLAAWLAADSPATQTFRQALAPGWPSPPTTARAKADVIREKLDLTCAADALLPAWFRAHCPALFEAPQLNATLARAPLWLRLQAADAVPVLAEFSQLGWHYQFSPELPGALRLFDEADVTATTAYKRGLIEIQDLGSQMILASLGAALAPGRRWLDACAGAGGKALQLAGLLGPDGRVEAHDIRADALRELRTRANRAGLQKRIAILATPPATLYDGVLVDAPCTGSGTWRRAPHLKWQLTEAQVAAAAAAQLRLLSRFSASVRPGGLLVYATCSLSRRENQDVLASFLAAHPDFSSLPPERDFGGAADGRGLTFLPATHDTDGFYVAALRRAGIPSQ